MTKRYGDRVAVDALDLAIPRGRVTGFVGPNGAGKTTTIRMLLGLVTASAGHGSVLGAPLGEHERYLQRVGALIESPAFYPALSGSDNLRVLASLGRLKRSRVGEALEAVDLADRADDQVKSYSLGMKQRLGIAAALLPAPELLILDEPTNGLDPAGIREVRSLLRTLADEGMTVIVSSHQLSEIEAICDHLVLIQLGRLRFQGPVTRLLESQRPRIHATPAAATDAARLLGVAQAMGLEPEAASDGITAVGDREDAARLNAEAFRAGIHLAELRTRRPSLEDAFFALTDGDEATP